MLDYSELRNNAALAIVKLRLLGLADLKLEETVERIDPLSRDSLKQLIVRFSALDVDHIMQFTFDADIDKPETLFIDLDARIPENASGKTKALLRTAYWLLQTYRNEK